MSPGPGSTDGPRTPGDWEQRYAEARTPWDLGGAPPVLVRTIAGLAAGPRRRVLVPGAGLGHDALAWARAGHGVTAVDLAPSACRALEARAWRAGVALEVLEADLFALPARTRAAHDLVWEQTCLCALPLDLRAGYPAAVAEALRPGGLYLGLFWNHGQGGGPPFDLTPDVVRRLFAPAFAEQSLEPVPDSVPGRRPEFLYAALRRSP